MPPDVISLDPGLRREDGGERWEDGETTRGPRGA